MTLRAYAPNGLEIVAEYWMQAWAAPMKLFKHLALHGAPKSSVRYIDGYFLAENEDVVADHLIHHNGWDLEDDTEDGTPNPVTYAERMRAIRGSVNDEDLSWEDAYYGVTAFGWDGGVDINDQDAEVLLRLGIATKLDALL